MKFYLKLYALLAVGLVDIVGLDSCLSLINMPSTVFVALGVVAALTLGFVTFHAIKFILGGKHEAKPE